MKVKLGIAELSTGLSLLRQAHVGVAGVCAIFHVSGDLDTHSFRHGRPPGATSCQEEEN